MYRNILALLLIVSIGPSTWSAPLMRLRPVGLALRVSRLPAAGLALRADEVAETLARAEALYYEADFTKSIELLLHADELLQSQLGHQQEKATVKLQLALAYVGLNNTTQAKIYFRELYALDFDHAIDAQQFSPKILQLAEQAKAEQGEIR